MRLRPRESGPGTRAGRWRWADRDDGWSALQREIDRSRRHGHELALMRLAPPAGTSPQATAVSVIHLRAHVRSVDSAWADSGAIVLLLPESDRTAAERCLARLRLTFPGAEGAHVRIACFPSDGLTAGALRATITQTADEPVEQGVRG
jgi:hypothetical protein